MKFYQYKRLQGLLLAGLLAAGTTMPAFAAEQTAQADTAEAAEETDAAEEEAAEPEVPPMTLEEIQKQVLRNNRLQKTLELNIKKITAGLSAIDDGLDEIKKTQDSAASSRSQTSASVSAGQAGVGQITAGAGTITGNAGTLGGMLGGSNSTASGAISGTFEGIGSAIGGLASINSGLLSGMSKTASAMEDIVDSIADQQRDTLKDQQTELKNTRLDLNKTQEDWRNEALAVTQLLVTKAVQVEQGVQLLTQKQAILERLYQIEEKKQELGFSVGTDLSAKQLEVAAGAKDLQDAKDGLTLLKRQLNDLMGRELDEALAITPPELTREIQTAPEYSEELLKTAIQKNYKLKTLRRDKQQAREKSEDMSQYAGQIRASELDMDIADVAIKDQEATVANDLKKKLDRINAAAATYQNAKDANQKAKIEWQQQQQSAVLGLVSAVELQALELQYEQTELTLAAAGYDYDLAWAEYNMLMDGTSLDIYDTYKAQVG